MVSEIYGLTPTVWHRNVTENSMKDQALADFLAARPIPDDLPLATDLPIEKVMTVHPKRMGDVFPWCF